MSRTILRATRDQIWLVLFVAVPQSDTKLFLDFKRVLSNPHCHAHHGRRSGPFKQKHAAFVPAALATTAIWTNPPSPTTIIIIVIIIMTMISIIY
jgi:hypothetical protein